MIPLIPMAVGNVLSDLQGLVNSTVGNAATLPAIGGRNKASFSETLKAAVDSVNNQIVSATGAAASYAAGNHAVALSSVMVSLEKANLAFQTASTVRDRVTQAYNTVMNMQI